MGCRLQTKEKRSETVTTEISLLVYVPKSIYETSDGFVVKPSPSAKKVRENLIVIMITVYGRLLILQACICFLSVFHYLFRVHQRQLLQMLSPRLRSLAIHFTRNQGTLPLANLVMGL